MADNELLPEKYGDKIRFDPKFKGPRSTRSCTDVIWLLIFLVFLGGYGYVAYYSVSNGDLQRLLVPVDSRGLRCGLDSEVKDKPYLVFFDLALCADPAVTITGCPTPQVCVKECPTEMFELKCDIGLSLADIKSKLICDPYVDLNSINSCVDVERLARENRCAPWYLPSDSILNRCVSDLLPSECPRIPKTFANVQFTRKPRAISNPWLIQNETMPMALAQRQKEVTEDLCSEKRLFIQEKVKEKIHKTTSYLSLFIGNLVIHLTNDTTSAQKMGQMIVEDIMNSWWQILISLILSMFVSLIFIAILRWLAAPLIWFSIIGVLTILLYAIYASAKTYSELKATDDRVNGLSLYAYFQYYIEKKETWIWIIVILSIIFVIILLIVIVLRKRISIAIAIIKEGSKAVSSIISTVFFPLFPWLLQVVVIFAAIIIGLYLASVGEEKYHIVNLEGNPNCACEGAASLYKNNSICDPAIFNEHCRNPITTNLCTDGGCHFKGIEGPKILSYFHAINIFGFFWLIAFISAFGEMVLAMTFATWYWTFKKSDVPFFTLTWSFYRTMRYHLGTIALGSLIIAICRVIRAILEYINHKLKKYDNSVTRAIMCCLRCFFWCLEKFLLFLNKNAYIMCAIHGKNFCTSAKDSFNLLMRNVLRVIVIDKVTDFLFFLAKLLISLLMSILVYYFYDSKYYTFSQMHYTLVPVVIVFLGTYLITSVFFGVYSMAVDTLFLCFLEDCERNEGTTEKPYFMSKQLMKILRKRNKIERLER